MNQQTLSQKTMQYFKPIYDHLSEKTAGLSTTNANNRDFFVNCIKKYGILLAILIFVLIIIHFSTTDILATSNNLYIYYALILIPLIAGIFYLFPLFSNFSASPFSFLIGAGTILFLIGGIYLYSKIHISQTFAKMSNIAILLIICLFLLLGLAIFYKLFLNILNRQTGWLGFIIQFAFYLPCLISDILTSELKTTPNVVFVLFVLEILLVLLYFYLPPFINSISISNNNIDLLKNSVFLNLSKTIAHNEIFRIYDSKNITYTFRKNYAFSLWIYVNPQQSSYYPYSKETNIFDYGDGKPSIKYSNENQKGTCRIQYSNNTTKDNSVFEIDILNQKWNYLVFNINDNITDLFINGKLAKSVITNNDNIATFSELDTVTIGEDNGLDGAICNVKYYKNPLTKYEITNSYNLLMYKNPPIQ
jgi:hypothetical protein